MGISQMTLVNPRMEYRLQLAFIVWCVVVGFIFSTNSVCAKDIEVSVNTPVDLKAIENAFTRLAESVTPVVVAIEARVRQDVLVSGLDTSSSEDVVVEAVTNGSGFIIRPDGYIVTNHHVIQYADDIRVVLHDRRSFKAEVIQFDHRSDLALLRIDAFDLPVAKLGDIKRVKAGQWAFTVGNPFGVAGRCGPAAFSVGVVGGLGRSMPSPVETEQGERFYGNLIQTDASLNPGSSGGPLFNIQGEVIGIGTVIVSLSGAHEGLGFAIPISDRTRRIMDLLLRGEPVRYGQLGVEAQTSSPQQPGQPEGGVRITAVRGGGSRNPAARAGLRSGDVVIAMNGQPITCMDDFKLRLNSLFVDDEVAIRYVRQGQICMVRAKLVGMVDMEEDLVHLSRPGVSLRMLTWKGLKLAEPTEAMVQHYGMNRSALGLYILGTTGEGPLGDMTDVKDDFVVACNGQAVRTVEQLAVLGKGEDNGGIRLQLRSGRVLDLPGQ